MISNRTHFDAILAEKDRALTAALSAVTKANEIAATQIEANRVAANGHREDMNKAQGEFLTRREFYLMVGTATSIGTLAVALTVALTQ